MPWIFPCCGRTCGIYRELLRRAFGAGQSRADAVGFRGDGRPSRHSISLRSDAARSGLWSHWKAWAGISIRNSISPNIWPRSSSKSSASVITPKDRPADLCGGQRLLPALARYPLRIARTIEKMSEDELKIQLEHRGIEHVISELDRSGKPLVIGLFLASLIVASALVIAGGAKSHSGSACRCSPFQLLGVWLIYGIFRSGRL